MHFYSRILHVSEMWSLKKENELELRQAEMRIVVWYSRI